MSVRLCISPSMHTPVQPACPEAETEHGPQANTVAPPSPGIPKPTHKTADRQLSQHTNPGSSPDVSVCGGKRRLTIVRCSWKGRTCIAACSYSHFCRSQLGLTGARRPRSPELIRKRAARGRVRLRARAKGRVRVWVNVGG